MSTGEISDRLRWARDRSGLSHRALSAKAKVSPGTISGLENGHHVPRTDVVAKLARVLGVTPCWLAYGDGIAPEGWDARKELPTAL